MHEVLEPSITGKFQKETLEDEGPATGNGTREQRSGCPAPHGGASGEAAGPVVSNTVRLRSGLPQCRRPKGLFVCGTLRLLSPCLLPVSLP